MAKWREPMSEDHGKVRVVNYIDGETTPTNIFGEKGDPLPVWKHRFEQNWHGTWAPIPVYHDDGTGNLTEIPQ